MGEFHFDEIIEVARFDNRKLYDQVSRVVAKSDDGDCDMEFDVHTGVYPMHPRKKYRMLISATLNMDASPVTEGKQKSLADKFEYVMHGVLYKMTEEKGKTIDGNDEVKVVIYISFGGLQFMLKGYPSNMEKFAVDQHLFFLMREFDVKL